MRRQGRHTEGERRTGEVTRLEGDHLVGVGFGVLGLAVHLVLQSGRGGRHYRLGEQRRQLGTGHVLRVAQRGNGFSTT